jgi:hypothetical protein
MPASVCVTDARRPFSPPREFGRWIIRQCGTLLQVQYQMTEGKWIKPKPRGPAMPFSPASRLRMLKAIQQVDWSRVRQALFVTLTYPDGFKSRTLEERTQDRYLMHRYIEKHLGKHVAALWRTEWKSRQSGALVGQPMPHVHLMLFGVPFINAALIRQWWRTILGHVGPLATDVRKATDGRHAARYIAKYVAKLETVSLDVASYLNRVTGRAWGWKRPELVPWARCQMIVDVSPALVEEATRLASEVWRGIHPDAPGSFTLFADTAKAIFAKLRQFPMADPQISGYDSVHCEGERAGAYEVCQEQD